MPTLKTDAGEVTMSPLLAKFYAHVDAMVAARMSPMNTAWMRLHFIDGVPVEAFTMEHHQTYDRERESGDRERWRDVLLVDGKPVYEVISGWEGDTFKVTDSWLVPYAFQGPR